MRIEDKINIAYENLKKTVKKDSNETNSSGDKLGKSEKDKIELNSLNKVGELVSKVKSSPEVRSEKVNALKKEIENSRYDFSGRKVAEKIVNTALDDLF
jgi:negative regulator of flagellin synthesis FlgM